MSISAISFILYIVQRNLTQASVRCRTLSSLADTQNEHNHVADENERRREDRSQLVFHHRQVALKFPYPIRVLLSTRKSIAKQQCSCFLIKE